MSPNPINLFGYRRLPEGEISSLVEAIKAKATKVETWWGEFKPHPNSGPRRTVSDLLQGPVRD